MKKRIADFLEKVAAGSLLVALFQGVWFAYIVCVISFAWSLKLTKEIEYGK